MADQNETWRVLLRETWAKWGADNASSMAAGLAFYTLFAIVPLFVFLTAALSAFLGRAVGQYELSRQITGILGANVAQFVIGITNSVSLSGLNTAAGVSIAIALVGALGAFRHLKWSLERMWQAPPEERSFLHTFLPTTGLFILVIIIGGVLTTASLAGTLITVFASNLNISAAAWNAYSFITGILIFYIMSALLFAAIYHFLPKLRLRFRDTMVGALTTAFLFTLARIVIGLYAQLENSNTVYGGASAAIALLLWVYFSAWFFYFGAEFTYVYAHRRRIIARENLNVSPN